MFKPATISEDPVKGPVPHPYGTADTQDQPMINSFLILFTEPIHLFGLHQVISLFENIHDTVRIGRRVQ